MKIKIVLSVIFATIIFVALMFLVDFFTFSDFLTNSVSTPVIFIIYGLLSLLAAAIVIVPFCFFLKDNVKILGLKSNKWHHNLLKGALLGICCIIAGLIVIYFFGNIEIQNIPVRWTFIITSFFMTALCATSEELFFRGFVQSQFMKSSKPFWVILLTSLMFVLLHIFNQDITLLSVINIFLASILLGFSFYHTKSLYFPIGLHIFWNSAQSFLGFSVSGEAEPSFWKLTLKNENIINGGNFGFEGSIICTLILLGLLAISLYSSLKAKK